MKILVTGGAGFIGSHIVDLLLQQGHSVVVVDDLSNGSLQNLNPAARFYRLSINDAALQDVFAREQPEIVCHQAAHTVVTQSVRDPVHDATINILGSLNLLAISVRHGVRKVVYASSCAIYGEPEYLPLDEKHPINPLAPYGVSKYTVEKYLGTFESVHGLPFVALRYANVYGPRQNPRGEAGVVALFSRNMLAGKQPTIFGNGDKTRAYVYVGDVARANLLAIESEITGIYNIGTVQETTDQAVFDNLSRELKYPAPAHYDEVRPGEILHMSLDCTLARLNLGWVPHTELAQGMRLTADYYSAQWQRELQTAR